LESNGISFFTTAAELRNNVDCLFSLGGDGTLLNAATLIQNSGIPVLGINTGRLGFLSSIQADEFAYAIDEIKRKKYTLDKRTLLELKTKGSLFGDQNFALNEVTILKKDISSMITTHVYLDEQYLNTYWGDGIIIATPTGSTAYSLSCGGPIVMPESGNMIITPIAPHNLNVRPIVIPDSSRILLKLEKGPRSHLVTLDSRPKSTSSEHEFEIQKAKFTVDLIRMEGYSFFNTLRNKLNWGLDKRN
jgi:NAD+ kinase